ncbi:MAG: SUF system NifU family Fe-S cluster assembly protein [Bacilli bacterium]|nr:SUF system NifU family Fe-S cluster assembly protein [Bacilli bacterium]
MNELDIYNELIMEHAFSAKNKKELEHYDSCSLGHNPNCGDEIKIELKLSEDKNTIEDMSFTGHGCAISQASTSMMIDLLKGKSIDEAKKIIEVYLKMIRREEITKEEERLLKDVVAFKNISNMPARVKCALLAWHTLDDMLNK